MKKTLLLLAAAATSAVVILAGCAQETPLVSLDALSAFSVNELNGQSSNCVQLLAGQTIPAGTVCFAVVGDVMEVTYTTTDGWELTEAHLWVGCDSEGYPQTKQGNPIPGKFPHKSGDITGATSYSFVVPLSAFPCLDAVVCEPGNLLYAMSHAAVRRSDGNGGFQTETGWGDGTPTPGANWATQSVLTLRDDSCGGGETACYDGQVAFAYGGSGSANCFLDIDVDGDVAGDFSRWGWSNSIAPGTVTWPLFADAIGCDRARGQRVGTVTVTYEGSTVTVRYDIDPASIVTIANVHIYVGNEILPRDELGEFTVAPRLYPAVHEFASCSDATGTQSDPFLCDGPGVTTFTETFTGLSGDLYVVAHAGTLFEVDCP